jgi:hypothetical protein
MEKKLSDHAAVAKLIRAFLKSNNINGKVKSRCFSGGNAVDVEVTDLKPEQMAIVEKELAKYEEGHFDSMNDIYEYSNSRSDIPQVKYAHVRNDMSNEMTEKVKTWLSKQWDIVDDNSAKAKWNCWMDQAIWRAFNSSYQVSSGFWE